MPRGNDVPGQRAAGGRAWVPSGGAIPPRRPDYGCGLVRKFTCREPRTHRSARCSGREPLNLSQLRSVVRRRVSLSGGQEAFFEGHEHAFRLLGGVPSGKTRYDNLKAAVAQVTGLSRSRVEADRWTAYRSHCEPLTRSAATSASAVPGGPPRPAPTCWSPARPPIPANRSAGSGWTGCSGTCPLPPSSSATTGSSRKPSPDGPTRCTCPPCSDSGLVPGSATPRPHATPQSPAPARTYPVARVPGRCPGHQPAWSSTQGGTRR